MVVAIVGRYALDFFILSISPGSSKNMAATRNLRVYHHLLNRDIYLLISRESITTAQWTTTTLLSLGETVFPSTAKTVLLNKQT